MPAPQQRIRHRPSASTPSAKSAVSSVSPRRTAMPNIRCAALRSRYAWTRPPHRRASARPPHPSEAGRRTEHSNGPGPRLQHHAMTIRKPGWGQNTPSSSRSGRNRSPRARKRPPRTAGLPPSPVRFRGHGECLSCQPGRPRRPPRSWFLEVRQADTSKDIADVGFAARILVGPEASGPAPRTRRVVTEIFVVPHRLVARSAT